MYYEVIILISLCFWIDCRGGCFVVVLTTIACRLWEIKSGDSGRLY